MYLLDLYHSLDCWDEHQVGKGNPARCENNCGCQEKQSLCAATMHYEATEGLFGCWQINISLKVQNRLKIYDKYYIYIVMSDRLKYLQQQKNLN